LYFGGEYDLTSGYNNCAVSYKYMYKAAYKIPKASFNSITMATVIIYPIKLKIL
jgi:hypothetical protein